MEALEFHVLLRLVGVLTLFLQSAVHHACEEREVDLELVVSAKVRLVFFRSDRGVGGAFDAGCRGGGEEWSGRGRRWDRLRLEEERIVHIWDDN